jgi:hypothetical protein
LAVSDKDDPCFSFLFPILSQSDCRVELMKCLQEAGSVAIYLFIWQFD